MMQAKEKPSHKEVLSYLKKLRAGLTRTSHYTGVVLEGDSRNNLLESIQDRIPEGWEILAHHMTTNLGSPYEVEAGDEYQLYATAFAMNDKVAAVKVETDAPSSNETKHITIAVNRAAGAKPFMSNQLTEWEEIDPILLSGSVKEENIPKEDWRKPEEPEDPYVSRDEIINSNFYKKLVAQARRYTMPFSRKADDAHFDQPEKDAWGRKVHTRDTENRGNPGKSWDFTEEELPQLERDLYQASEEILKRWRMNLEPYGIEVNLSGSFRDNTFELHSVDQLDKVDFDFQFIDLGIPTTEGAPSEDTAKEIAMQTGLSDDGVRLQAGRWQTKVSWPRVPINKLVNWKMQPIWAEIEGVVQPRGIPNLADYADYLEPGELETYKKAKKRWRFRDPAKYKEIKLAFVNRLIDVVEWVSGEETANLVREVQEEDAEQSSQSKEDFAEERALEEEAQRQQEAAEQRVENKLDDPPEGAIEDGKDVDPNSPEINPKSSYKRDPLWIRIAASLKHKDKIPGGAADDKKPEDFNKKDLSKGTEHEKEHSKDKGIAREIAMDHLTKDKNYYGKKSSLYKAAGKHPYIKMEIVAQDKSMITDLGALIDPEDLTPKGLEDDPHSTLAFGLELDPEVLGEVVSNHVGEGVNEVNGTITGISSFEGHPLGSVIHATFESPELEAIAAELHSMYDSEMEFIPHLTIGFVKPEASQKYLEDENMKSVVGSNIRFELPNQVLPTKQASLEKSSADSAARDAYMQRTILLKEMNAIEAYMKKLDPNSPEYYDQNVQYQQKKAEYDRLAAVGEEYVMQPTFADLDFESNVKQTVSSLKRTAADLLRNVGLGKDEDPNS